MHFLDGVKVARHLLSTPALGEFFFRQSCSPPFFLTVVNFLNDDVLLRGAERHLREKRRGAVEAPDLGSTSYSVAGRKQDLKEEGGECHGRVFFSGGRRRKGED